MTLQYIIGIDPGKTTGVSVYDVPMATLASRFESDVDTFIDWAHDWTPTFVAGSLAFACERFDITPTTGKLGREATNWSIEVTGVIRHLARRNMQLFSLQSRASRNKIASNANLKSVGWYLPGHPHANDGTRHVVLYLMKELKIPPPWIT
jgi:hypothetical protein